jgi:hypothetical protein
MTFAAELRASLGWTWDDGAVDDDSLDYVQQFAEGNGDGQAEAVWHLEDQVLPDGTSATLDMTALERVILGDTNTVTFVTIKAVLLSSDAESVGNLVVGGAATDPWSAPFATPADQAVIAPDGLLVLGNPLSGWPVDAGDRILQLAASGGDVTYSAAIVGTLTAEASGSGSGSGSGD